MTIQALAWAIEQALPGKAKLVLHALANHADHTNGFVHFDASTIAHEAFVPERSLWRYLGALERNGYLAKDQRKTAEGDKREYWLALDRDPALPWAWAAHDGERHDADDDEAGVADPRLDSSKSPIQGAVPASFNKTKQTDKRDHNAAQARKPDDPIPVIEGSKAFKAWCDHCRAAGRIVPFLRSMIVNGKEVRGFPMPTLFPPNSEDSPA